MEAEHFECALEAIDMAAKYRPESAQQIREYALQGFSDFVAVQQRLFAAISRECAELRVLELVLGGTSWVTIFYSQLPTPTNSDFIYAAKY